MFPNVEGHNCSVVSALVSTSLGEVCCYFSGREDGPPVILLHGCPSSFRSVAEETICKTPKNIQ